MSEVTSYLQGTPCWVELSTSDRPAAMEFYAAVFDWEYQVAPPELGHYTRATRHGKAVAGIVQPPVEPGERPAVTWTTYFSCDDAEATRAAIEAAGGQPVTGVLDVLPLGRALVATDPTGAEFGIWEPGEYIGAELVNEPGALVWNELATPDPVTARDFYTRALGVTIGDPVSAEFDYTPVAVGGRDVAGIMALGETFPPETPAHWTAYFSVTDTDATAARVAELGGGVVRAPADSPYGQLAVLRDPQGGTFTAITAP